jgi:hypothetical protein
MSTSPPTPPSTPPEQDLDAPDPPSPASETAEADQDVDIVGTEADEPGVGAALETPRRPAGPDDVDPPAPRR